jgi:hypothetical protein
MFFSQDVVENVVAKGGVFTNVWNIWHNQKILKKIVQEW